ncbi:MAG: TetR/AcrR family transcriptional regulator [Acidobacteriota bacterium]|jgi:TetR/AcrR family transcriptional regulator|nr:TetR/AcrR family transcriptional regulator [Acidobacteriota bacterium]OQB59293.1 MAG: DNA-binding transcriptional repressor AcrR [Candidatus Aminicenantes bacterium ADurb.Bin147]HNQ81695.1 TetR/AcrR family transcriptional regulator [Candidatus Aminicenantes bacterium]MDD8010309.1 TetR/AcrR family transcriptional regulator [Acidobacteriota bacterium]MDD8034415.1 TetR/AcrR family transcriptional regulator [Acidobacteriota bacterium]
MKTRARTKTGTTAAKKARNPYPPGGREDAIRQFILEHSEHLFVTHGYGKTSMDMVARECGLSKPTLYKYFKNKYEMFTSLYERLYRSLNEMFKLILGRNRDKAQVLEEIILGYFLLMTSKKDFLKMYFREQHLVVHENIEEHMSWHVESRKKMEEMLAQCLQGILRPDIAKRYGSAMVASTLFDILEGMVSNLILHGEQDPAKEKAFILEFLRSGVLARSA